MEEIENTYRKKVQEESGVRVAHDFKRLAAMSCEHRAIHVS